MSQHWQWDSVPVSKRERRGMHWRKSGRCRSACAVSILRVDVQPADVHSHSVALIDICTGLAVTNMIYDSRGTPILSFVFLVLIEFSQSPLAFPSGLIRFTCYNLLQLASLLRVAI